MEAQIQAAVKHFRRSLFTPLGLEVPEVVITVAGAQKRAASCNYDRWRNLQTRSDLAEISISRTFLAQASRKNLMATPVHEMVHAADCCNGTAATRGRHGSWWWFAMRKVGLEPEQHDARSTRYNVGHHIVAGGAFEFVVPPAA